MVREQAAKKAEDEARKKRENPRKPFHLQEKQSITALVLTPDEKYVIASVTEPGTGTKTTIVPNFVTESGYTEDISSRNKVGDVQNSVRLAILNVETGEVKWADAGQKIPPEKGETKEKDRDVHLFQPVWSEDGTKAAMLARAADNKDRWILALDEATGKTRVIVHDHDDAWIDGPGSFTLGWMKTIARFISSLSVPATRISTRFPSRAGNRRR